MSENNSFVPLGSIVLLKGGTQKLLIISRAISVQNNGKQYFFDYGAVSYPEGLVGDQMAYFNKESISMVVFEGYHDIDDINMQESINAYLTEHPDIIKGTAKAFG